MLILVNTALTIFTLGIFSAWAKVRTKKYLYGNTYIDGANFNYHADPLQILKGRLIIGALFLAYVFGGRLSIVIPIVAGLIFVLASPWLFVQGMAFNLSNTSYRNIRFGFNRKFQDAYILWLKGWLLTVFTLGIGMPYFLQRIFRFQVNHSRYGQSYMNARFTVSEFYSIYLRSMGLYILSFFAFGAVVMIATFAFGKESAGAAVALVAGVVLLYGGILMAMAFIQAQTFNTIFAKSKIESVEFIPSMKFATLAKLYVQNIFIALFTLGFGIPYCLFRLKVYKAQCVSIKADAGQFDQFAAMNSASAGGAVADAATDFWDFDVGF